MDNNLVTIEEEAEADDRIRKCGLCHESLRTPRLLPCFDVFCTECLERHFLSADGAAGGGTKQTVCPKCKEPVTIPPGGVKNFRQPSHVTFLTDILCKKKGQMCRYFCEISEKKPAESYCIDCSLPMCATCRKMHSRVRGADTHNVISFEDKDFTDITSDINDALKNRETHCSRHDQQPLRFFCDACKMLACQTCVQERHSGAREHKIEPLEKMAENRRKSLSELSLLMQDYQKSARKSLQSQSRYLVQLKEDCTRAESHVDSEAAVLIAAIKAKKKEVLSKLQAHRLSEEESAAKEVDSLKWTDRQLNNVARYAKEILSYGSDAEVVEMTPALQARFRDIRNKNASPLNPQPRLKVKLTKVTKSSPEKMFGDLQFGVTFELGQPDLQKAAIIRTLTTDGSITGIAATEDDCIVVASFCSKKVSIYRKTGSLVCDITKDLKQPISVAVTSSQHVLVTDLGENHKDMGIRSFSTSGVPLSDHVTLPDSPWGIGVKQNGDMVVCHPERRAVVIYSKDGALRGTIHSTSGRQLFSNPRCVAVNTNGDIVVTDFAKHRLYICDPEGNLLRTYGSEGQGDEQLCHPCGVCCDQHGHILIADSNNNRIHVLTAEGDLKGYVLSKSAGLDEPVAVEVDKNGDLIIGEWSGRIHIVRYL